ncbi:hypothetical protein GCM10023161_33460 [Mycobacterium paraffinicum]|uniref:Beta-lactamase-related domain-containing protein n=1 Tax=Mycobacterium paraffinicum TaxID=53378 RepID=A0ABP8EYZ7_9MYCO
MTSWVSTSFMGTCSVLVDGGFLDWKWHATTVDETRIATVTKSLIFPTVIEPIMA